MSRVEELEKEGWKKRFIIDEPRLSEVVAQYEEIGFDVLLEPPDTCPEECVSCMSALGDRSKMIYTRPKR